MLGLCRRKAEALGLSPTLHHARMEDFAIDRRFRTIFVVSSSFMLLPELGTVRSALACIRRHLQGGGRLLAAFHLPEAPDPAASPGWRTVRESVQPDDGSIVRCESRTLRHDETRQEVESLLRYRRLRDDRVEHEEEHVFRLSWHTQAQLAELLFEAGFAEVRAVRGDWTDSRSDDRVFVIAAAAA